jgi:hypothetical protein
MHGEKADEDINLEQRSKRLVYSKIVSRLLLSAACWQQDLGQSNSNESRFLRKSQLALVIVAGWSMFRSRSEKKEHMIRKVSHRAFFVKRKIFLEQRCSIKNGSDYFYISKPKFA